MPVKQVIVWRHDLKVRLGKFGAQVGHGVLMGLSNKFRDKIAPDGTVTFRLSPAEVAWFEGNFRKIVLRVESEGELDIIYNRAKELGLPVELVVDSGLTEFHGVPTKTCLSIGPEEDEKIDQVTGESGPLGRLKPL